jgi:hypothetical protein
MYLFEYSLRPLSILKIKLLNSLSGISAISVSLNSLRGYELLEEPCFLSCAHFLYLYTVICAPVKLDVSFTTTLHLTLGLLPVQFMAHPTLLRFMPTPSSLSTWFPHHLSSGQLSIYSLLVIWKLGAPNQKIMREKSCPGSFLTIAAKNSGFVLSHSHSPNHQKAVLVPPLLSPENAKFFFSVMCHIVSGQNYIMM